MDTGLAQTRDSELPPGAEILNAFFSNTSILSHTLAIEELIGIIRMAPRFTPQKASSYPYCEGYARAYLSERPRITSRRKQGRRKKETNAHGGP